LKAKDKLSLKILFQGQSICPKPRESKRHGYDEKHYSNGHFGGK
jgi:hypothetical protein